MKEFLTSQLSRNLKTEIINPILNHKNDAQRTFIEIDVLLKAEVKEKLIKVNDIELYIEGFLLI